MGKRAWHPSGMVELPASDIEVLPGLCWGRPDDIGTPAFWAYYGTLHVSRGEYLPFRIGQSLIDEIAACMLCGYGVKAEVGMAAYARLRDQGLLAKGASAQSIESALREPLSICDSTPRYRFPHQKALAIAAVIKLVDEAQFSKLDDLMLRNRLTTLPGIGLKTASFIVRNFRGSDEVAILDVHVVRAGKWTGFFDAHDDPAKSYIAMELKFLLFSRAIKVRPAVLDSLMWDYSRDIGWIWTERGR